MRNPSVFVALLALGLPTAVLAETTSGETVALTASESAPIDEVEALLSGHAGETGTTRLEAVSAHFLGRPYVVGPLGEGPDARFDQAPAFRVDGFDCTTFVETTLALAYARPATFAGFIGALDDIRYRDGIVDYVHRNHFPELEWVTNNVARGFLRDITAEVAGNSPVATAEAIIDRRAWYRHRTQADVKIPGLAREDAAARLAELRALGDSFEPQRVTLTYLPWSTLRDVAKRIPSGTVLNVVREHWNPPGLGTPLLISHQGLVIRKAGKPYFRHASLEKHRVVDMPLLAYFRRFANDATYRGVNLLRLVGN